MTMKVAGFAKKRKIFFIQAKSDISKADASSCFSADLLANLLCQHFGILLYGLEEGREVG